MKVQRTRGAALVAGVAATALALAPTAHAASRTYVSSSGLGAGNCTITIPCSNVSLALASTDPGGKVVITDSSTYPPFTVTKPVTITARPGERPEIHADNASAITINTSGKTYYGDDDVELRHLDVTDNNVSSGPVAGLIAVNGGDATLNDVDVSFAQVGIGTPTGSKSEIEIVNSRFHRLSYGTYLYNPKTGIDNSRFDHNYAGLITQSPAPAWLTIDNSRFDRNFYGILDYYSGGLITNSRFVYSDSYAIYAPANTMQVGSSVLAFNGYAYYGIKSYGDNRIYGNSGTTGDTAPPRVNLG